MAWFQACRVYKFIAWLQGIGLGCVQAEREVSMLEFATSTTQANIHV